MTRAEQVLADWSPESVGLAQAAGQTAPPLTDEQITRLRVVLADQVAAAA